MWNLKQQQRPSSQITENRLVIARGWRRGAGKMGEVGQKGTNFQFKISHRDVMYSMVTSLCCIAYLKVAKTKS